MPESSPGENYARLPFEEALDFLRGKELVGTKRWNDLWRGQHDAGFMVAGMMKHDLLQKLRDELVRTQTEGHTLRDFRKVFDAVAAEWGDYYGSRDWRSRLIYETNLSTAYAAGRYEQMTDPDVLEQRPFWLYRHGGSENPRPHHLSWDGLVLRADDPWWATHYPPSGWGCSCVAFSVSEADVERRGLEIAEEAPEITTREWTDPKTGITQEVPEGIDPGWGYAPGATAGRSKVAEQLAGKLERLDADLGAGLYADTKDYALDYLNAGFSEWADRVMRDQARAVGDYRVIGVLPRRTLDYLEGQTDTAPLRSAAVIVTDERMQHLSRQAKRARGRAIAEETARHLPRVIAEPDAVLWDKRDPAVLYVYHDPQGAEVGKVVVRVQFTTHLRTPDGIKRKLDTNMVRTAGVVPSSALKDQNQYEVIEGAL